MSLSGLKQVRSARTELEVLVEPDKKEDWESYRSVQMEILITEDSMAGITEEVS